MFKVLIDDRVVSDLQNAIDFYNSITATLGKKFEKAFEKEIGSLALNPYYQVRYKGIRCKLIKNYPYLIHYTINSELKEVYVFAVICTHKNPKGNWL